MQHLTDRILRRYMLYKEKFAIPTEPQRRPTYEPNPYRWSDYDYYDSDRSN